MVGWGCGAAFTEFDAANGEVLCDARFGAEALFEFSPVSSYRVFRGDWRGLPTEPPSAVVKDGGAVVYASWNGATEVASWLVERVVSVGEGAEEGGKGRDEAQVMVQKVKIGFETAIELPRLERVAKIRVVALRSDGQRLGASAVLEILATNRHLSPWAILRLVISLTLVLVAASSVLLIWRRRVRRRTKVQTKEGYRRLGQEGSLDFP
jgi:hypothetical protein